MRAAVPRLITFDVTGTLLMTPLERHYAEAAAKEGLRDLDGPRLARTFRATYKRLDAEHPIYGKHTGLGWENWWRVLVHDVFVDQRRDIDKGKLDKIADSLIECYGTSRCWHKYPGTLELLDSLSRRDDLVLGVISNFDERLENVLNSSRIRPYFSFVLTSYRFGVAKPDPAIFHEALNMSSRMLRTKVEPSEAVHIGDRIDNDYLGARSAHWNAILIKRDSSPVDHTVVDQRDIFHNFSALKKHLEMLFDKNAAVCS